MGTFALATGQGDTLTHAWYKPTVVKTGGDAVYKEAGIEIFEDGRASCAYMYANKVNGRKTKYYDPWANDQDWALVYYFMVNGGQVK